MKKIIFFVFIFIPFSCQIGETIVRKDFVASLRIVGAIREKSGFVPMEHIYGDFNVSSIDFAKHNGMKKIGVNKLVLDRHGKGLTMLIASESQVLNRATIETIPNENGFQSQLILKNGYRYSINYIKDKSADVTVTDKFGKLSKVQLGKDRTHDEQLTLAFKLPVYVHYAIRELFYIYLIDNMPEGEKIDNLVNTQNGDSHGGRTANSYCNFYPSVYAEIGCALYTSICLRELKVKLNQKCWNTYCTGCCNSGYDPWCIPGASAFCVIFGSGYTCTDYPRGNNIGADCSPNSPCPFDSTPEALHGW